MNFVHLTRIVFLLLITSCRLYADPFVYVANIGGSVSVIDMATNMVVATIPAAGGPRGVAITPDGKFAYVTNGSNAIYVIDTATNTIVGTITAGSGVAGIAITPDGTAAYVTNSSNATVSVISIETNMVVATVSVGSSPFDVSITPNGQFAYVSNLGAASVSVINTATHAVVATIPMSGGGSPRGSASTPDSQFVYVAASGTVQVISTASNTVITTIPSGGATFFDVAITPNGQFAYAVNRGGDNVLVIATSTNTFVDTIPIPAGPFGSAPSNIAISSDGQSAYVTDTELTGGFAHEIDLATNTVVATIAVGSNAFGIAITPVSSPNNLKGKQKNNIFAFESELFNHLTWTASSTPNVVSYNIYRDGVRIDSVASTEFDDHNRKPGQSYLYAVTAVLANGGESSPRTVVVP
jgi:YVTN family beta-propeller protein